MFILILPQSLVEPLDIYMFESHLDFVDESDLIDGRFVTQREDKVMTVPKTNVAKAITKRSLDGTWLTKDFSSSLFVFCLFIFFI